MRLQKRRESVALCTSSIAPPLSFSVHVPKAACKVCHPHLNHAAKRGTVTLLQRALDVAQLCPLILWLQQRVMASPGTTLRSVGVPASMSSSAAG